jgi:sec-independent protein translocase protein TatA
MVPPGRTTLPTSLGPAEILVILVVALIVLGPKKLPEAGRQVGKAIAEVRKWSQGFQDEIKSAIDPEGTRPSYSQPQPGYDPPPLPVIPAETSRPAETTDVQTNGAHTNGSGTVTTGSHGLVSGPPPADTTPTDGPPAGDAPQP